MSRFVHLYLSIIIIGLFGNVEGSKFTSSECDRYLKNVSEIVGLAFDCFGEYSQPVAFCGQCAEIMEHLYDILQNSQAKTEYGVPCLSFINSSSIQSPIKDILWKVVDTWQSGRCSSCLVERRQRLSDCRYRYLDKAKPDSRNSLDVSSSYPDYKYSSYNNQTLDFFFKLNDVLLCITPFIYNTSVSFLDPVNFPPLDKVSVDATVCTFCKDAYRNLTELYSYNKPATKEQIEQGILVLPHISVNSKDGALLLCRDVGDALNRTHWVWHHMLNCTLNRTSIRPIVALIPLITCGLLLVLFHCCLLCCCHRPIRLILYKPRRVEAASPNTLAPLSRNDISNHNFQSFDSTDNNDDRSRSLSVPFRQRKFDSQCRNFSYNILRMSHAQDNC